MLVVPAPFCPMRDNKDPPYLPTDTNGMENWKLRPRKPNLEFRPAAVKSRTDYRNQQTLRMVTLRDLRAGKELATDYHKKYCFELPSIRNLHRKRIN